MAILSDEFYYQHINLDTVNTQVFTNLTSKVGDTNGRGLIVTLTENGLQKDTTGISLNLKWKHRSVVSQGLDNFDVVDLSKGVYKITYPTEMNRSGLVDAFVQIVDSGKVVGTRNMIISVESTVGDDSAIESSNSFSALASALIEVQSWNDRIDVVEQEFIDKSNNLDAAYPTRLVSVEQQLAENESKQYKLRQSYNDGTTKINLAYYDAITRIEITQAETKISFVALDVLEREATTMVEIALYDNAMNRLATTGKQETNGLGINKFALPPVTLKAGMYYIGISSPHPLVIRGDIGEGYVVKKGYPMAATYSALEKFHEAPYVEVYANDLPTPTGFVMQINPDYRVFCKSADLQNVYAWHVTTGRVAKSVDAGATFADLMIIPEGPYEMVADEINGRLYLGTAGGKIYESTGLLSSSSFVEITPPLKNVNAKLLPHGMEIWNGWLWYGEYSFGTDELTNGVQIHKYNLTTKTWIVSAAFNNARHVHSFAAQGTSALYATVGDAGYGVNVGIHRLTTINPSGADTWELITKNTTADVIKSDHYPVDNVVATIDGVVGLLGASDRVKMHLTWTKLTNTTPGSTNINAKLFAESDAGVGETARNVILDSELNCYYVTEETTVPRLYVSPYPYVESYRLYDFDPADYITTAPVKVNDWIMFHKFRFHTVSFGKPQNVVTQKNTYLYDKKEIAAFTSETSGAQTSNLAKNTESLFIESLSNVDLTIQYSGYRTTSMIDLASINNIIVEGEFLNCYGTNHLRLKVDTATSATTSVKEKMIANTNLNIIQPFTQNIDVAELTGNHYFSVQALAWNLNAKGTVKISRIYAI